MTVSTPSSRRRRSGPGLRPAPLPEPLGRAPDDGASRPVPF